MLLGYALTLLAFLFFGRYFQGNYLGYIVAVASAVPFLVSEQRPVKKTRSRRVRAAAPVVPAASALGGAAAADAPAVE
jgi:hypothetical protein